MPGFEDLVRQVGSSVGGSLGTSKGLLDEVVQNLTGPADGLGGLVRKFTDGGLGDVVKSWVSTGQNLPVSAAQLQQVFGADHLKDLATKAGLSAEVATSQLGQLLPMLVDKLTPEGKLPSAGFLEQALDFMK